MNSNLNHCPDELALAAYLDDLSSPRERAAIREHLRKCPVCRDAVAEGWACLAAPAVMIGAVELGQIQRNVSLRVTQARRAPAMRVQPLQAVGRMRALIPYAAAAGFLIAMGLSYGFQADWLASRGPKGGPAEAASAESPHASAAGIRLERTLAVTSKRLSAAGGVMRQAELGSPQSAKTETAHLSKALAQAGMGLGRGDETDAFAALASMEQAIDAGHVLAGKPNLRSFLMNVFVPAGKAACRMRQGSFELAAADLALAAQSLSSLHRHSPGGGCSCDGAQAGGILTEKQYQNLYAGIEEARGICSRHAKR